MKLLSLILTLSLLSFALLGQTTLESTDTSGAIKDTTSIDTKKKPIIKTGWNLGPLPVIAFDADKGFQFGALLNLFDFGDGSTYPNPRQKWYFEASFFTKGSQFYKITYDTKFLIPGVRFSASANLMYDTAMDFYGFNGYQSYYDHEKVNSGNNGDSYIYTPYYKNTRIAPLFKADFIGNIWENKLFWEAGYHFMYVGIKNLDRVKVNKGKEESEIYPDSQPTLYEEYQKWGIIPEDEAKGGISSALRLGLLYDTRNKEGAPSKGIWAEGHLILAPKFLGTTHPYSRYSLTFRHYVPIVKNDILTFAYRIAYQGTIGKTAPFYVLPFYTIVGVDIDREGFGGFRTVRGLLRNRVQALDVAFYNAELRWRFVTFTLWNQNISFAANVFSDGTMATRNYDMSYKGNLDDQASIAAYKAYLAQGESNLTKKGKDKPHITAGGGLRFIMNENFIVCAEYGMPFNKQDGNGSFYVNIGYLF